MADPVSQFATRIAYGARQLPRVAWYIGHGMVMRRLSQAARERAGASARPRAHTRASVPDRRRLYADMAVLFRQDLANVEAGIYPLPADHDGTLPVVLNRSRLFFADLPDVHRRREKAEYRQVLTEDTRGKRPDYYLQNFHFQSGGWLTEDSARRRLRHRALSRRAQAGMAALAGPRSRSVRGLRRRGQTPLEAVVLA